MGCSYWQEAYHRELIKLREESQRLNLRESSKIETLSKAIKDLSVRISVAGSEPTPQPLTLPDITSLEEQMARVSLSKTDVDKQHCIIRSLTFESQEFRHEDIALAHHQTFGWVFDQTEHPAPHSTAGNFQSWLERGSGCFWVSGKPGSGKSTLMKFITGHPRTRAALATWSSQKPIVIASHYFWSAGKQEQKSQRGLLKTLLHEIFLQHPDIIEISCAERWPEAIQNLKHKRWGVPELNRALSIIAEQRNLTVNLCFFIDGLDEFEGDHEDFCQAIQELSKSPHVKVCVSSRPWNVFEHSFGHNEAHKLYMHELTRNDIRSYVTDQLQRHPRWHELELRPQESMWLIDEITDKSAGVFLWVRLATRQLRRGLTEYDTFTTMKERLEYMPADLEIFFKQILNSVDPFYHGQMACTLLIALAAGQPVPPEIYDTEYFQGGKQAYALSLPIQVSSANQATASLTRVSRRLNTTCRGLLEISSQGRQVEFLHRTVRDFLKTSEMYEFLWKKAPDGFVADLALLRGFVVYLKSTYFGDFQVERTDFCQHTNSNLVASLKLAAAYAKNLGELPEAFQLLDEIDRCIPEMQKSGQAKLTVCRRDDNPVGVFFRDIVLDTPLTAYLSRILPERPGYFADLDNPASTYICLKIADKASNPSDVRESIEVLKCVFDSGLDPNMAHRNGTGVSEYSDTPVLTPWSNLLQTAISQHDFMAVMVRNCILQLFLEYGADPETHVVGKPAWAIIALHGTLLTTGSPYSAEYLQLLDDLVRSVNSAPKVAADSPKQNGPNGIAKVALDNVFLMFRNRLKYAQEHANNLVGSVAVLMEITDRFLAIARIMGLDCGHYWQIAEDMFGKQVVDRLKNKLPAGQRSLPQPSACDAGPKRLSEEQLHGGNLSKRQKLMW